MGWGDVVQSVVQRYTVEDAGATSTLTEMASSAIGLASTLASVEYTYNRVMGLIGRGQSLLMSAVNMGAQRSELELTIAGTLRAYEVSGARMSDINRRFTAGTQEWRDATIDAFNVAQQRASGVLAQISRDADALPGEAEQYLQTFQTMMPAALATTRRSLEEITALSNLSTAVGLVNQEDAPQVGRDMLLLMQGSAGMDNRFWRTIQALVHNPGRDTWANLTQEQRNARLAQDPNAAARRWVGGNNRSVQAGEFNRWQGEQRFESIRRALEVYKPLLDRMSHTWSTQMGTLEAGISRVKRIMAMPVFEAALNLVTKINEKFGPIAERLGRVGAVFTNYIAQGIELLTSKIDYIWKRAAEIGQRIWNSEEFATIVNLAYYVYGALRPLLEGGNNQLGLVAGLFGTAGAVATQMLQDPRLLGVIQQLASTIKYIVDRVEPFVGAAGRFQSVLADFAMSGLVIAVQAFGTFVRELYLTWTIIRGFGTIIYTVLQPALSFFGAILTRLGGSGNAVSGAIRLLAGVIQVLVAYLGTIVAVTVMLGSALFHFFLGPVMMLGRAVIFVVEQIQNAMRRFIPGAASAVSGITEGLRETFSSPQFVNDIQAAIAGMGKVNKNAVDNERARQPTPHISQDFRYSRFDITQRFAEGFDPDRVASAFASELEALSENRMESGFQPAFSTAG